jgi:raffinose/stachyose/melibiose transport system substrate-binding protein
MRASWIRQASCSPRVRLAGIAVALVVFALAVGASEARPAGSDQVTITMLAQDNSQTAYDALIANFERAYPNITVDPTWGTTLTNVSQLETTELAAGNAPDLLATTVGGCSTPIAVCLLARAGDLAPMIRAPWTKWSPRLLTSLDKYGPVLYAFTPAFSVFGVFTDNALFARLGLTVPQTFSQLLALCQKAHAAGTDAVQLGAVNPMAVAFLILGLAVATLYGHDKDWNSQLRAGTVSFDGTPGWHQALQEFIDMYNNACFQPGFTGDAVPTEFAQGQALMNPVTSSLKPIDPAPFSYSFYPFPGGTSPSQTRTFVNPMLGLSINAHASPQAQAAAQTFINFIAQPRQDALYAKTHGALTPFELLKGQVQPFMSPLAAPLKGHEWVLDPFVTWWNPNVLLTLETDAIGLVTGQSTIDGILQAMDAAWKQGPS